MDAVVRALLASPAELVELLAGSGWLVAWTREVPRPPGWYGVLEKT